MPHPSRTEDNGLVTLRPSYEPRAKAEQFPEAHYSVELGNVWNSLLVDIYGACTKVASDFVSKFPKLPKPRSMGPELRKPTWLSLLLGGPFDGCPYQDPHCLGSVLGPLTFGKSHMLSQRSPLPTTNLRNAHFWKGALLMKSSSTCPLPRIARLSTMACPGL